MTPAREAGRRRDMRRDAGFALAWGAALTAYNNALGLHRWHREGYVPLNACATVAALAAARASGLTAADLGLGRGRWLPGRAGCAMAAAVGAGWLLTAAVPATRPLLRDKRITGLNGRAVAYQALVRIPVGTVLWEEIAFRGVLQAALRRVMPQPAAVAVASLAFGIWHVRPTAEALGVNGLTGDRRRAVAGVAAGVAATTVGGALFSGLRARSGSLTAPVLLHLATNCAGLVAAWAAARPPAAGGRRDLPAQGPDRA
jgi:hypothetical protein